MSRKFANILETIGNTPVVRIGKLAPPDVNLFVKIEAFNPLGSVKDRLALGVIEDAERPGLARGHVTASDDHVQRRLRADKPGQPLRAAAAWQDADKDLRQSDLRAGQREAVVAGHRHFEAAAEGCAVNGDDHGLLAVFDFQKKW